MHNGTILQRCVVYNDRKVQHDVQWFVDRLQEVNIMISNTWKGTNLGDRVGYLEEGHRGILQLLRYIETGEEAPLLQFSYQPGVES